MLASTTREGDLKWDPQPLMGSWFSPWLFAQLALAVSYSHNKLSIIVQSKGGKLVSGFLVDMKRHLGIDDNLKL